VLHARKVLCGGKYEYMILTFKYGNHEAIECLYEESSFQDILDGFVI